MDYCAKIKSSKDSGSTITKLVPLPVEILQTILAIKEPNGDSNGGIMTEEESMDTNNGGPRMATLAVPTINEIVDEESGEESESDR